MKRTFLGVLAMGFLVGAGAVGVYFAQQHFASLKHAHEHADRVEPEDADDHVPAPIPLATNQPAASTDQTHGSGSPFARQAAQRVEVAEDPYPAYDHQPAAVEHASGHVPDARHLASREYAQPASDPYAPYDPTADDDIPDAEPLATHDKPQTYDRSRFAEQPASAELVEDANADEPKDVWEDDSQEDDSWEDNAWEDDTDHEPRHLAQPQASRPDDGYDSHPSGNPLRAEPAVERYDEHDRFADEQLPAEAVSNEYQPPVAGPAATEPFGDDRSSFGNTNEGTGRPGDPQLNGAQAPALTIEKAAPPEIQIGKPAKFLIKVRNAGTADAQGVEIHDAIPQGTQLLDTSPPAHRGADGSLRWELGTLRPGDEQTVELQLMPTAEGEIGSVATVHFRAEASVRTLATKPMLDIEVFGPSQVLKGESLTLRIKLSNPGSGAAAAVVLTENVPAGLSHSAGRELEFEVGTLQPGESRELDLTLAAVEPGIVTNVITAEGEASLRAEAHTEIEVIAPRLQVSMSGPKRRILERNATHNISVSNPGTASAKDIDLVAVLPRNLKFVEANNGGQFDAATHAVYWSLEELPPQETGTVKLTTLPLEAGDAKVLIKSMSPSGLRDEREEVVTIEGLAAINFELSDVKDPVEVGGETAYEIRVTNQGTKAASNVRLEALLPRGMKALSAEGPVRYQIEGARVQFEPLRQLAPKADTTYTIKVRAEEPGDLRVEVRVSTDEIRDPITREESTHVFSDE